MPSQYLAQVVKWLDTLPLVGRESIGSTPIDEMVSLVIGSNPILVTKKMPDQQQSS